MLGNVAAYSQTNNQIKYYDRYQFVEPYVRDKLHVNSKLTLNLGFTLGSSSARVTEKYNREYNFQIQYLDDRANAPVA